MAKPNVIDVILMQTQWFSERIRNTVRCIQSLYRTWYKLKRKHVYILLKVEVWVIQDWILLVWFQITLSAFSLLTIWAIFDNQITMFFLLVQTIVLNLYVVWKGSLIFWSLTQTVLLESYPVGFIVYLQEPLWRQSIFASRKCVATMTKNLDAKTTTLKIVNNFVGVPSYEVTKSVSF